MLARFHLQMMAIHRWRDGVVFDHGPEPVQAGDGPVPARSLAREVGCLSRFEGRGDGAESIGDRRRFVVRAGAEQVREPVLQAREEFRHAGDTQRRADLAVARRTRPKHGSCFTSRGAEPRRRTTPSVPTVAIPAERISDRTHNRPSILTIRRQSTCKAFPAGPARLRIT
jgi:hypothetical protein